MTYWLSNGRVTDDVTWRSKVLWGSTVGYPSDSLASCRTNMPECFHSVLWVSNWSSIVIFWGNYPRKL